MGRKSRAVVAGSHVHRVMHDFMHELMHDAILEGEIAS
jgi:hypothetical protein